MSASALLIAGAILVGASVVSRQGSHAAVDAGWIGSLLMAAAVVWAVDSWLIS